MISRDIFRMIKGMVSMIFSKIHSRMICSHMKMRNERVGQFPPCSTEFLGLFFRIIFRVISSINSYFKSQMREERVGQFPVSFLDPTEFQVPLRARLCTLPSYSVHFIALRTTVSTTVEFDVCIWSNVKQVFCCLCKQFSAVHFSVEKTVCATKYLSRFDICPGITFELATI